MINTDFYGLQLEANISEFVFFEHIASTFGSTEPSSSTEQKTKTTENYDAESGK